MIEFFERLFCLGKTALLREVLENGPTLAVMPLGEGEHLTTLLNLAAKYGNIEFMELLLAPPYSVDVNSEVGGYSALLEAVWSGQTAAAEWLLQHDANPNACDARGNTPLHFAVRKELPGLMMLLGAHGADPKRENEDGFSPFDLVQEGKSAQPTTDLDRSGEQEEQVEQEEKVEQVEAAPESLTPELPRKFNKQWSECLISHLSLSPDAIEESRVQWLLTAGADPDKPRHGDLRTPLHLCILKDKGDALNVLLQYGADPNCCDVEGNTALHLACRQKNLMAMQILRSSHVKVADINALNAAGQTPLDLLVENGPVKVWELRDLGARFASELAGGNALQPEGAEEPMEPPPAPERDESAEAMLVQPQEGDAASPPAAGADSCAQLNKELFKQFKSSASLASIRQKIQELLEKGADPDCVDEEGRSLLHYCARGAKPTILKDLLEKWHAHPCVQDFHGDTPLHVACSGSYTCIVPLVKSIVERFPGEAENYINMLNAKRETPLDMFGLSSKRMPPRELLAAGGKRAAEFPRRELVDGLAPAQGEEPALAEEAAPVEEPAPAEEAAFVAEEPRFTELAEYPAEAEPPASFNALHELMDRVFAFYRVHPAASRPPLLRYALDPAFLSEELYHQACERFREGRMWNYAGEGWALTLCLVRSFFEVGDGSNPFRVLGNHSLSYLKWLDSLRVDKYYCLLQRAELNALKETSPEYKFNRNVEWMRSQCPVLKACEGGVSSEMLDCNRVLWDDAQVQACVQGDWEELLARPEALLSCPEPMELPPFRCPYTHSVWLGSRYYWMLILKAITTPKGGMPESVRRQHAWLEPLEGIAAEGMSARARWFFQPFRQELYLQCAWPKKYGQLVTVKGRKSERRRGGLSQGRYSCFLAFSELKARGLADRPGDISELQVEGLTIPVEQDAASPYLIFQADRCYQGGYSLLGAHACYPRRLRVLSAEADGAPNLKLRSALGVRLQEEGKSQRLGGGLVLRSYVLTYPPHEGLDELGRLYGSGASSARCVISARGVAADIQVQEGTLFVRVAPEAASSDKVWRSAAVGRCPSLFNFPADARLSCPNAPDHAVSFDWADGVASLHLQVNGEPREEPLRPLRVNVAYGMRSRYSFYWLPDCWQQQAQETRFFHERQRYAAQMCRLYDWGDFQIRRAEQEPIWLLTCRHELAALPLAVGEAAPQDLRDTRLRVFWPQGCPRPQLCLRWGEGRETVILALDEEESLMALVARVEKKVRRQLPIGTPLELLAEGQVVQRTALAPDAWVVPQPEFSLPLLRGEFYPPEPRLLARSGTAGPRLYIPAQLDEDYALTCHDFAGGQPVGPFSLRQIAEERRPQPGVAFVSRLNFLKLPDGWYRLKIQDAALVDDEEEEWRDVEEEEEGWANDLALAVPTPAEADEAAVGSDWFRFGSARTTVLGEIPPSLPEALHDAARRRAYYAGLPRKVLHELYDAWARPMLSDTRLTLFCPPLMEHYCLRICSLRALLHPWPFPKDMLQGEECVLGWSLARHHAPGGEAELSSGWVELCFGKELCSLPAGVYVVRLCHTEGPDDETPLMEVCFRRGAEGEDDVLQSFDQRLHPLLGDVRLANLESVVRLAGEPDAGRYCEALKYPLMKEALLAKAREKGLLGADGTLPRLPHRPDGQPSLWRWHITYEDREYLLPPMKSIYSCHVQGSLYWCREGRGHERPFAELVELAEEFSSGQDGCSFRATNEYVCHYVIVRQEGASWMCLSRQNELRVTLTSWTEWSDFGCEFHPIEKRFSPYNFVRFCSDSALPFYSQKPFFIDVDVEKLCNMLCRHVPAYTKLMIEELRGEEDSWRPPSRATWGEEPQVSDERLLVCRRLLDCRGNDRQQGDLLYPWFHEYDPVPDYPAALREVHERLRAITDKRARRWESNRLFKEAFRDVLEATERVDDASQPLQRLRRYADTFFKTSKIPVIGKSRFFDDCLQRAIPELVGMRDEGRLSPDQKMLLGRDGMVAGWLDGSRPSNPAAATALLVALCFCERFREESDVMSIRQFVFSFLFINSTSRRCALKHFIHSLNQIFPTDIR